MAEGKSAQVTAPVRRTGGPAAASGRLGGGMMALLGWDENGEPTRPVRPPRGAAVDPSPAGADSTGEVVVLGTASAAVAATGEGAVAAPRSKGGWAPPAEWSESADEDVPLGDDEGGEWVAVGPPPPLELPAFTPANVAALALGLWVFLATWLVAWGQTGRFGLLLGWYPGLAAAAAALMFWRPILTVVLLAAAVPLLV